MALVIIEVLCFVRFSNIPIVNWLARACWLRIEYLVVDDVFFRAGSDSLGCIGRGMER